MSAAAHHRAVAEAVSEALEGQRLASHLLARLRTEILDPDDLMRTLVLAQAASDDRLRGFARRLQKALEQEVGHATK